MYFLSVKRSLHHGAYKVLQVFLLFGYKTRNTADDVCQVWSTMTLVYGKMQQGS